MTAPLTLFAPPRRGWWWWSRHFCRRYNVGFLLASALWLLLGGAVTYLVAR